MILVEDRRATALQQGQFAVRLTDACRSLIGPHDVGVARSLGGVRVRHGAGPLRSELRSRDGSPAPCMLPTWIPWLPEASNISCANVDPPCVCTPGNVVLGVAESRFAPDGSPFDGGMSRADGGRTR
jgi:hypothetical protein